MKKGVHYFMLGIFVVLMIAAWGRSIYHSYKYAKIEAPESISLEAIMENVAKKHIEKAIGEDGDLETNEKEATNDSEVDSSNYQGDEKKGEVTKLAGLKSLNIEMDFYSQAPKGNWDLPYQEACEEASVLLVANLLQRKNWTVDDFDQEILKIVAWEKGRFGAYEHTTVDQTVEMIKDYLGLQAKVHENPSFEDVQQILSQGHLIVAPFSGKDLGNPFYTNGGPIYHMMVIKGFDVEKKQIVTSDVGTRRGADYVYEWEKIESSLHDWHDEDIKQGGKRLIEVWTE